MVNVIGLPLTFERLVNVLKKLPGISRKQAERIAFNMIGNDKQLGAEFIWALEDAMAKTKPCQTCGLITEKDICEVCTNNERQKILVVVESSFDVFKFESAGLLKPYYHVLGGLINVSKSTGIIDLNTKKLSERAQGFKEVILALSPNLEGIVTANLIKNMLVGVKTTQLAQGIPLGAAMEYVDELTLKAALDNRKEAK